ncbi:MAG: flagellar hook-length control protein FliK, partial [Bacillota bacterium]|nr:flagellar hook-length control protein FliK [Bacillota bacterium]
DYSNDKFIDGKNLVKAENAISLIKQGISKSDNSLVKSFLKDVLDNDVDSLIKMSQEFKDDGISSEDKLRDFINNKLLFSGDLKEDVNNTKFNNLKYNSIDNSIDNGAGDLKEEINLILKNIIDKLNNSQDNKSKEGNNNNNLKADTDTKENKVINKIFNSLFVKIDSDNLKDELNTKNLYKEINKVLDVIRDTVSNSDNPMKDQIINKTDNIENSLRFIGELNNHSSFLQIPIKIINENTNCDLYILKKNSKKKKIDPSNVTAYISLDTSNIGKLDTLISLNKKNISVNMRVGDEKIRDFIKNSHNDLYKRLSEIGYKLVDLKCRVTDEDISFININGVLKNEIINERGSVDYKI